MIHHKTEDSKYQKSVREFLEHALKYHTEYLAEDIERAERYYYSQPFYEASLDKEDAAKLQGSQAISPDVMDVIQALMPSIHRAFLSEVRKMAEFVPEDPQDAPLAELQHAYVRHVIFNDNPGYKATHDALLDGLLRRMGVIKWWWEEKPGPVKRLYDLDQMGYEAVFASPGIGEVATLRVDHDEEGNMSADVEIQFAAANRCMIEAVPPSEFVFSQEAKHRDDSFVIAHSRHVPLENLVAMGYDKDMLTGYVGRTIREGYDTGSTPNITRGTGRFATEETDRYSFEDMTDVASKPVRFTEAYCRVDRGDGLTQLRKFDCVGEGHWILNGDGEPVDAIPFAVFTPIQDSHTILGISIWDRMHDVQRIKSKLERGALDSASQAIHPQLAAWTDYVNEEDLLYPQVSGVIRTAREPGRVMQEFKTPFVGQEILALLEYYDQKKGDRTGMNRANEGLDPKQLQSSTAEAITNTFARSQEVRDGIARSFAETGWRQLLQGVYRCISEKQGEVRNIQLGSGGPWVPIDPRPWTLERQVRILPREGNRVEQIQSLNIVKDLIIGLKEATPLVTNVHIYNVVRRMIEIMGYDNPDEFLQPWDQEAEAAFQQQQALAAQNAPPDPALLIAQAEVQKASAQTAKVQSEVGVSQLGQQLDVWVKQQEDDRERMRIALEEFKVEADTATKIGEREVKMMAEQSKVAIAGAQIRAKTKEAKSGE